MTEETHQDRLDHKADETANEITGMFQFTQPQDMHLVFQQDSEEVGRFWYDKEAKEFKFKGDKAKSATEFVAWCLVTFREQLKEHYIKRPENKDDTQ